MSPLTEVAPVVGGARRSALIAWLPVASIACVPLVLAVLLPPQRAFPIEDDWAYAQVVQSILRGQFHLSEFLAPSSVVHVYWGALWCAWTSPRACAMSAAAAWMPLSVWYGETSPSMLRGRSPSSL